MQYREAMRRTMTIFFFALSELGYSQEELGRIWRKSEDVSDSIIRGYASYEDMRRVLKNEYGIEIS